MLVKRALLIVAVLVCLGQSGDVPPSVRASICLDKQCTRTSRQGFAPATIRASYFVPRHADNYALAFGLTCTNGYENISQWNLDGERETMPAFIVSYRDVPAGDCMAALALFRRGQEKAITAQSARVIVN